MLSDLADGGFLFFDGGRGSLRNARVRPNHLAPCQAGTPVAPGLTAPHEERRSADGALRGATSSRVIAPPLVIRG